MNGELAQAVALVAHARVALLRGSFELDAQNSTFKYVGAVEFERVVPRFLRTPRYECVATSPRGWYEHIAADCLSVALRVRRAPGALPSHVAVAFAGNGGWGVEVTRHRGRSLWRGRWSPGNPEAVDRKVWSVLYREFSAPGQPSRAADPGAAAAQLGRVLADAEAFAVDANVGFWGDWFHDARQKLEAPRPRFEYHPDMLPTSTYSLEARQLVSACERAWVFGGMGSWNDLGFPEGELQRRYDQVTPSLYEAVVGGIESAVNEPLR